MSITDIIKAWKDEDFRAQLVGQGVNLPESPVGMIDLEETDLEDAGGMGGYRTMSTCDYMMTCGVQTFCHSTCPMSEGGHCS